MSYASRVIAVLQRKIRRQQRRIERHQTLMERQRGRYIQNLETYARREQRILLLLSLEGQRATALEAELERITARLREVESLLHDHGNILGC